MYNLTVAGLQIGLIFFISPGPTLTLLLRTSASPLSLSPSLFSLVSASLSPLLVLFFPFSISANLSQIDVEGVGL